MRGPEHSRFSRVSRFFHQCRYTSFQRQLNLYGFSRFTVGLDRGGYYHPSFLRGRPELCGLIHRTKVKGTGVRQSPSPESEPDFYSMEYCYEEGPKQADSQRPSTHEVVSQKLSQIFMDVEKILDEDPLFDPTPLPPASSKKNDCAVLAEQGYPQVKGRFLIASETPSSLGDPSLSHAVFQQLSRGDHL